jgi:hypothetical protein
MKLNNKPISELSAYSGGISFFISSLLSIFLPILNILLAFIGVILIVLGIIGIITRTINNRNKLLFGIVNISLVIVIASASISLPTSKWGRQLYFVVNERNLEKQYEIESSKISKTKFYRGGCFNDTNFTAIELYGMLDTRYGFVKIKNGNLDSETRKRMGRISRYLQKVGNNWYYYNTGN